MNLRKVLIKVREGGVSDAFSMVDFLKSCGYKGNVHVGTPPKDFDDKMTIEWYLGQGIHIMETNALFAMNSWLNCIEKYIPESMEVNTSYFDEGLFEI